MDYLWPTSTRSTVVAACCVCGVVLFKRWLDRRNSDVERLRKPTGGHWLWGHEKLAWETPNDAFYYRSIEELGSTIALKSALFRRDILMTTDPAALNHVNMKNSYDYVKDSLRRQRTERLVGRSLLWSEGAEHRRQRQMISPALTHEQIKNMSEEIRGATQTLVDRLRHHILTSDPTQPEATVNVLHWTSAVTLDIIGIFGFGHDFQCGTSPEARAIQGYWSQAVTTGLGFTGFIAPIVLRIFPWLISLPVSFMKAQGGVRAIITDLARKMVDDRTNVMPGDEKVGNDLLSTLMRTAEANGESLERLLDHIVAFVVAGHETTSATAAFALLELARNRDIQARLRQEIIEFEGSEPGGEPSYTEFQTKLPLLDAVCKEALRLYPVGSRLERIATKDDVIPLRFPVTSTSGEQIHAIRIKKGQLVSMPVIAANCNTTIWGPDGHVFRPQRWLENGGLPPANSVVSGVSQLFTFSEGPRLCVGYRLALYEFKVILAALVKNFEFLETDDKIDTIWSTTLQPFVVGKKDAGIQLPLVVRPLGA
ncbi:hypothetical protein FRB99_002790 [Tulasnella sp. 403]|nr:hypothetical protein FRB99_002790 [Tulasnella sp. 403]